jgi:hypothetical protein
MLADEPALKQGELGTSVQLTFGELVLGDLAFGLAVGP